MGTAALDVVSCERNLVEQATLHSDNGSAMSGATIKATFDRLGVTISFSRPLLSEDNH